MFRESLTSFLDYFLTLLDKSRSRGLITADDRKVFIGILLLHQNWPTFLYVPRSMQKSSLLGNNSRRLFALEPVGEPLESILITSGELLATGKSILESFLQSFRYSVFFSSGSLIYFDWLIVIRIGSLWKVEKSSAFLTLTKTYQTMKTLSPKSLETAPVLVFRLFNHEPESYFKEGANCMRSTKTAILRSADIVRWSHLLEMRSVFFRWSLWNWHLEAIM
jgi:hypothetical protein